MKTVYLGLGSNMGDSLSLLTKALLEIGKLEGVFNLKSSRFFETSPVSAIPQKDFLNLVCQIETSLDAEKLFEKLQAIEEHLGKIPKAKNAPRPLDIDILFFGKEFHKSETLTIPHKGWKERLFVLIPLLDLREEITYPLDNSHTETLNLREYIKNFKNIHNEYVVPLSFKH